MWVQSIVLEYHRDISVFWFYIIYHFVTDLEFTACDLFQTCNHTKCSRFTTSRWSYKNDKFFIFNFKVEIFNCFKSVRICFVNML